MADEEDTQSEAGGGDLNFEEVAAAVVIPNKLDQEESVEQQEYNNNVSQENNNNQGTVEAEVDVEEPQIITTNLEAYLLKTKIGKEVFKCYKKCIKKNCPLPKKIRSKLVRAVIKRESDWALKNISPDQVLDKFEIKGSRFQILADEIASIFKLENSATYYTPFVQADKKCILASGKLWHHYNYVKSELREGGLLACTKKKNNNAITISENENDHIEWLSSHLDPWSDVVQHWKDSFHARRALYLFTEELSVSDYIEKFPCLSTQKGQDLYSLDFKTLYEGKDYIGDDKWDKIREALIPQFNDVRLKDPKELGYINCLKSGSLSKEKETFILLYLLAHLLPPKRQGKRKRADGDCERPYKLSLEERRESFIFRVETAAEIEATLLAFKGRLKATQSTFQPIVLAVGSATQINSYYVVVNEQHFKVDRCINAVVLALKIFFALDCKYPENTQTIWVFLQKILLNIHLSSDVVNIQMNVLLGLLSSL